MPQRFSEIFNLNKTQAQLDFVDVTPDRDTPLFIDPFAISLKNDDWSKECHRHIVDFFDTALGHIRSGNMDEAQVLLNGLSEPNETCLGVSTGHPAGRGVSGRQAVDLYDSLARSQAAQTGLLSELADCDLFVRGIGPDKLSDITTNIIRRPLITYTQEQCALHGIELSGTYPSGRYWDIDQSAWRQDYMPLPIVGGQRIILVPKYSVRRSLAIDSQEYYSHHVLNFIQAEEYARGSSLVRVLKNGERRPPSKKALKERFPFSKEFIAQFTEEHPNVLRDYKAFHASLDERTGVLRHEDFDQEFDEAAFARALIGELDRIPAGRDAADQYHSFIIGVLEFLLWPNVILPKKETPLHEGRKRIDITYTNAAKSGFFFRSHTAIQVGSNMVIVECKNYSKDPANPEVDQLIGRFGTNRGKLGIMLFRGCDDYDLLVQRCKDTAADGNGFIIPLGDDQIKYMLGAVERGARSAIDERLDSIFRRLVT